MFSRFVGHANCNHVTLVALSFLVNIIAKMSLFWSMTFGAGILEFFLDLFTIAIIFDVIALFFMGRCIWNWATLPNNEQKAGYSNVVDVTDETASTSTSRTPIVVKTFVNESTQTGDATTEEKSVQADLGNVMGSGLVFAPIASTHTATAFLEIKKSGSDEGEVLDGPVGSSSESSSSSSSSSSDDEEDHATVKKEDDGKYEQLPPPVEPEVETIEHQTQEQDPPPVKRGSSRDEIKFKSGWRKTVKLMELVRAKLIEEKKILELEREEVSQEDVEKELRPYLIGQYPIAGIYDDRNGQKVALLAAHKKGLISRGTAMSLLEAQAANGSIADPMTGRQMSVDEALENNLLDRHFASVLGRAERAVHGYKYRPTGEVLSLFQAMKKGLIVENHGIRLLEAQIATGGIIDPVANIRLPVETAYERGLFDENLHRTLEDPSDDTKGFLDPNTNENLTYLELMQRCVVDKETDLHLLPIVKPEDKQNYKQRSASLASSIQGRMSKEPSRRTSTASSTTD
ncbi:uncharacterized protein LOC143449392 isoform X1 [Clavelina lepadiformis]|uniref:uncharacterized protein LOC143449392 isoform X1 n=1 Tax=Clavelina lepadiformis TaxID=159417 RepID=UPI004041EB22